MSTPITIESDEDIYNYVKQCSIIHPMTLENLRRCLYIIKYLIISDSLDPAEMIDVHEIRKKLVNYRPTPDITGNWVIDIIVGHAYVTNGMNSNPTNQEIATIKDFIRLLLSQYPVGTTQHSLYKYNDFHDMYTEMSRYLQQQQGGSIKKTKRRNYNHNKQIKNAKTRQKNKRK